MCQGDGVVPERLLEAEGSVAHMGGTQWLVMEDPQLEVTGGTGGGGEMKADWGVQEEISWGNLQKEWVFPIV